MNNLLFRILSDNPELMDDYSDDDANCNISGDTFVEECEDSGARTLTNFRKKKNIV